MSDTLTAEGLLPASWTDNRPRRWTCRIGIKLATEYMRDNDLVFAATPGRKRFHPDELNAEQLLELAFLGTRWNAAASGSLQETFDEFKEAHADSPAYEDALFAGRAAILNFTLMHRFRNDARRAVAESLLQSENALRSRLREMTLTLLGPMPTSATSSTDAASSP